MIVCSTPSLCLSVPQLVVFPLCVLQELWVSSTLNNLAFIKDKDLVWVFDGGEPVGNGDAGCVLRGSVQRILDNLEIKKRKLDKTIYPTEFPVNCCGNIIQAQKCLTLLK